MCIRDRAHGDGQVHPGRAGDQVAAEHHRAVGHGDLRQQLPGGVAVAPVQAPVGAEDLGAGLLVDQHQAAAGFQQFEHFRDVGGAVARVRVAGALP